MPSVKVAQKPKSAKRGELHHMRIEKANNGVAVHQSRHPAPGDPESIMMHSSPQPDVFTSHAKAKKHVVNLLKEMLPPQASEGAGDGTAEGDEASSNEAGGEQDDDEAPVAQVS